MDLTVNDESTLEEYVAHLNSLAFWKEFTFAQNTFTPQPGRQLELADNLVWFGDFAIALQLKQREVPTDDPEAEASWFRRKILDKAVSQICDTVGYLAAHEQIAITNQKGRTFEIRGTALAEVLKVVVFLPGQALPGTLRRKRYHVSRTAGFVHLISAHDYLGILETLRVPEDIRRYLAFRQAVAPRIEDPGVEELDIMGAFLAEEDTPTEGMREVLGRLVQDLEAFDLSRLIGGLHDHIERTDRADDYYEIMLEFAKLPRSMWRAIKDRFMRSLKVAKAHEYARPYRVTFPETSCTFMIAPMHPDVTATGEEGVRARSTGLENLTYAAMYNAQMSKGIGILISMDGEYFQIDWCRLDIPWKRDPQMDAEMADNNPFRPAREQYIDSFLLVADEQ